MVGDGKFGVDEIVLEASTGVLTVNTLDTLCLQPIANFSIGDDQRTRSLGNVYGVT